MNVPKAQTYELIGACRILAHDITEGNGAFADLLPALLHEVADRLAELTQPQPIETAPRDGTLINLFWPHSPNGKVGGFDPDLGLLFYNGAVEEESPTHWLPCVQVDMATLEGKGDVAI